MNRRERRRQSKEARGGGRGGKAASHGIKGEQLAENDSGKMIVPYAENRVVMFNSDLFHETDVIDFKPGYENRRINITLLFGQRSN